VREKELLDRLIKLSEKTYDEFVKTVKDAFGEEPSELLLSSTFILFMTALGNTYINKRVEEED